MSVAQFLAMKIPQWMAKARTKKLVARLGKNPAQTQQNRTATMISYAMLVMIIVMGFTLPAAMGVYWFIGALISLAQSVRRCKFSPSKNVSNKIKIPRAFSKNS